MFLILLLCITVHSTPINDELLEISKLSKASVVQNKLIAILNNAKKLPRASINNANENKHINNQKGERRLRLNDVEELESKINYDDIKLAFNDEAEDLLKKLTQALIEVNENLSKQNNKLKQTKSKQIYVVKVDEDRRYARHKRDTNDRAEQSSDANDLKVNTNTTAIEAVSEKAIEEKTTEEKTTTKTKAVNETSANINKTEVPCNQTINSRRSYNAENDEVSKAVKNRLLSYINEYFNDIATKTNSLRDIKKTFAASDEYSIGYIIANIDTLGINLHDLRVDIELNHKEWSEKQILDMFDKIKMSHSVVSSLLGALKTIMDKPPVKNGRSSQYLHLVK